MWTQPDEIEVPEEEIVKELPLPIAEDGDEVPADDIVEDEDEDEDDDDYEDDDDTDEVP